MMTLIFQREKKIWDSLSPNNIPSRKWSKVNKISRLDGAQTIIFPSWYLFSRVTWIFKNKL